MMTVEITNKHLRLRIAEDGKNLGFVDVASGVNYGLPFTPFAWIKKSGVESPSTSAALNGDILTLGFGDSGVSAAIKVVNKHRYVIFEVVAVSDSAVEEFNFINIPLKLQATEDEAFAGCALALNLQTNMLELPGANKRLSATCYSRFGFAGAKAAVIGCPSENLRQFIQQAVTEAPDLPHSPVGGPWALDHAPNRGSYLLGEVDERNVDEIIKLVKAFGFEQFDFHGGKYFRFGDCALNPKHFPGGKRDLRKVIDRLHAAGILVGLHIYAFFIDKDCPWVTPVPDARLGKDAALTLAEPLDAAAAVLETMESPKDLSNVVGFHVRNSVTLQVDDELIVYKDISKTPPYSFTGCQRGAYGTKASSHAKGACVYHLRECFNRFIPDGESSLLVDVAAAAADLYNECGFDMIYLDAQDGEDAIAGTQHGWHYGTRFVYELWKRLQRPAMMEMSTFRHHLWYVRSRHGAWDAAARNHKRFIDTHVATNEDCRRLFLPTQLGWWVVNSQHSVQAEPVFDDIIEYLCAKGVGTDSGLAVSSSVSPESYAKEPYVRKVAEIIRKHETLRLSGQVPEAVKAKLREPEAEYRLMAGTGCKPVFQRMRYARHKIEGMDDKSKAWLVRNDFGSQPLRLRIEALYSATSYDDPENIVLTDFHDPSEFAIRRTADGIMADLEASHEVMHDGGVSGCYYSWKRTSGSYYGWKDGEQCSKSMRPPATFSSLDHGVRLDRPVELAWTKMGKVFNPPLDLGPDINSGGEHQALGLWIHGDGRGEVLNVQLRSPEGVAPAFGDRYVVIDFTGWRYVELIEHESDRVDDYLWPYSRWLYSIFGWTYNKQVETLNLWYNNLPQDGKALCYLSPIKALKLVKASIRNPSIAVGEARITFPVGLETGQYLEFDGTDVCRVCDVKGNVIQTVKSQGNAPILRSAVNEISFSCDNATAGNPAVRTRVTVILEGETI